MNLSLPWHMFGRSGHDAAPEGGVLRNYLRRARDPMSDVRGVRAFKVLVDPCHLTALRVHSMETDGSGRTCNDAGVAVEEKEREKPGFYSAAHLQLNHYYTRSEAELAAKIGRGPNLAAKRRSTRARCGGRSPTSRRTRLRTARRSTTWRGSGGRP